MIVDRGIISGHPVTFFLKMEQKLKTTLNFGNIYHVSSHKSPTMLPKIPSSTLRSLNVPSSVKVICNLLGYEDDIYLLIKLGQAAIIIFMIFAIFSIIFMMSSCCMSLFGAINDKNNDQSNPAPFTMKKQVRIDCID